MLTFVSRNKTRKMKVRVIDFDEFAAYCEKMGIDTEVNDLTDEQFMDIYNWCGTGWEFGSLKDFENEFNNDGNYAPTSTNHLIRFFENE